jgi:hypothetical protein
VPAEKIRNKAFFFLLCVYVATTDKIKLSTVSVSSTCVHACVCMSITEYSYKKVVPFKNNFFFKWHTVLEIF